jgi:hypothetical protein
LELELHRPRLLVTAVLVFVFAGYSFINYRASASYQSTFAIQPGEFNSFGGARSPGDTVTGQFNETTGVPVRFYVMDSAQFAAFSNGTRVSSLYNISETESSAFSYAFTTSDTYYLVFRHGINLLYDNETVSFQRTYTATNWVAIGLGLFFVLLGVVDVIYAFRPRKLKGYEILESKEPEPTQPTADNQGQ